MSCRTLVCCLEETSAKEMLKVVAPRLLPDGWSVQFITFEGKQDLLKRLQMRLQHWQQPDSAFLVMCDQDAQDCRTLKSQIAGIVAKAGKTGASKIRIACHELENFYLGDLAAVESGLGVTGLAKLVEKRPYRQPDGITNAPDQLKKISRNLYAKCAGSRRIAPHLDLTGQNKSRSFNELLKAIRQLVGNI